jgi:carboxymethylenebutenolidase
MERVAEITRRDIVCAGGMPGHLALPQASGKVPGVVILHERYGFVQHPRDVADRFAELGMAGLAVNGFHRCDYQDALAAGTKRYRFADPETVDIVSAAIEALAATGRVDTDKIAVLGMCQTGRHPMIMAAETVRIAAAICWYGAGSDKEFEVTDYYLKPLEDYIARLNCPLLGLFGEADQHIPLANVRRMRDLLEKHGRSFEIRIFEQAPHGFLNNTMPERYRARQAAAGWRWQMDFLRRAFAGGFEPGRVSQHYSATLMAA